MDDLQFAIKTNKCPRCLSQLVILVSSEFLAYDFECSNSACSFVAGFFTKISLSPMCLDVGGGRGVGAACPPPPPLSTKLK